MTRVRFYTLGCKVNQYETQVLAQRFAAQGYQVVEEGDADLLVVNSCTVTAEGDRKCKQLLRRLRRENPEAVIALTGCYPQAFPEAAQALAQPDIITGSRDRGGLVTAVEQFLACRERVVDIRPHSSGEQFEVMPAADFGRRTRAFVKIEDGCENYCSYCIIPTARGPVRSKPMAALGEELTALAATGHREVVLAGINLASYGRDLGCRFIDAVLLACGIPGIERVRLGSMEPELLTREDIAVMSAQPKLCPQFHLSLQSGSDAVLERMGRRYRTGDYMALVKEIRRSFPGASITTDLMVGFPGETEEEFCQSLDFAWQVGFAKVHVFAYSPRAGTPAAAMENQLPPQQKRQRSRRMMALAENLRQEFLISMIGSRVQVLFEERDRDGFQSGYTRNYTPVQVLDTHSLQGSIRDVMITGLSGDGCRGVLV